MFQCVIRMARCRLLISEVMHVRSQLDFRKFLQLVILGLSFIESFLETNRIATFVMKEVLGYCFLSIYISTRSIYYIPLWHVRARHRGSARISIHTHANHCKLNEHIENQNGISALQCNEY